MQCMFFDDMYSCILIVGVDIVVQLAILYLTILVIQVVLGFLDSYLNTKKDFFFSVKQIMKQQLSLKGKLRGEHR